MVLNFLPIEKKNIASRICMMLIVGYMLIKKIVYEKKRIVNKRHHP